jgi:hypothetical protein
MTRLKLVGWSLLSAILAEVIAGLALCLPGSPGLRLEGLFGFFYFATFLVIPGWILALPFVLTINRLSGWRIWLVGVVGCCIGPALLISADLLVIVVGDSTATLTFDQTNRNLVLLATGISILSTALYIAFVKLSTRDSIKLATNAQL